MTLRHALHAMVFASACALGCQPSGDGASGERTPEGSSTPHREEVPAETRTHAADVRAPEKPTSAFGPAGRGGGYHDPLSGLDEVMLEGVAHAQPRLEIGELSVTGALDPKVIRERVEQEREHMTRCYQRSLIDNPELSGVVVIRLSIAPKGPVLLAQPTSNTVHPDVGDCLIQSIKRWSFPTPADGGLTKVTLTLNVSNAAP